MKSPQEENEKSNRSHEVPLSWFTRHLRRYVPLYIEILFLAICMRLLGLVEPFIFQVIIDRILPFQREASLIVVVAIFALAGFFEIAFSSISTLLGILTANRVTQDLGNRIYSHVFRLPYRFFRRWSVGDIITRMGETGTINDFLVGTPMGIFLDLVFAFIYISALFSISPQLTIIVLIALPIQMIVYIGFGPFLRQRLRKSFDAGANHQTQMVESIAGISSVKAVGAEDDMLERLDGTLNQVLQTNYRVEKLELLSSQITFVVNRAVQIGIIFFGSSLVFSGHITLGQLIAFVMISDKVDEPISNFSGLWESWQNIRVSRQRLGDIVNQKPEPFGDLPELPNNISTQLRFEAVSFSYDSQKEILENFNFEAKANTLNLIIGPSGIGKSTFGRLAAGIDTPSNGSIYIDKYNISQFDPKDVRRKIAYVPQEPYLFSGSLRDNILVGMGKVSVSDHDIERALTLAGAEQLTNQLSDGLDTYIGERGSALSGGQRQRISIARSILKRPKILILDEPTSALDESTQANLIEGLKKIQESATLIVITHQPKIFDNADQIVNFEALS